MLKRLQALFCVSLLMSSMAWAKGQEAGLDYAQLKYEYMCSQGLSEKDLKKDEVVEENPEPDFTLPAISELERNFMVYEILKHNENTYLSPKLIKAEQQASLDILYNDLELFTGDGKYPEVNIASIIDRTWSSAGSAVLRKMLSIPLASFDQDKFQARQALIKELVANEALLTEADALCASFAHNEERMLANWLEADAVSGEVFNKCYWQKSWLKGLNNNPYAMEALTRLGNLGTALQLSGDALTYMVYVALFDYAAHKGQDMALRTNDASVSSSLWVGAVALKNMVANFYPPALVRNLRAVVDGIDQNLDLAVQSSEITQEQKDAAMKYTKIGVYGVPPVLMTGYVALKGYQYKNIIGQAKQVKDAINFLQEKMIGMGNVVRSVHALEQLGADYAVIADGLTSWQQVDATLRSDNDTFAQLVRLLDTNTCSGESSFFSLSGRVLAANELMKTEKNKFAGALEVIGELDACVSVAKLYRQFAGERVGFCFAEVEKSDKPFIDVKGFWNPFVDHNVVVANDLALGGDRVEQNVVLTGSNTGGKSTVGLKGTLISLYLAHTFGIAPAESCSMSAFADFCSYLHILDSVAAGESAFQAEINRANSLIKAVNALGDDEFAFVVIDELFKGTSPEKGAPGAYKVIKHLAGRKNVIFIIATHFSLLTELQNEVDSVVNMKLEIYEDEQGNLIKPYKLEEGISTQNIADILMESGLDFQDLDLEQ